ncbi:MAG: AbrB/MazE/SpoVT family DNA-binding domain-containing protein [Nitrococcus sp.]|nr:AbrB/MazE/SpoVT family DNA-binding domain-containing protein [Nitrococcus sp.]
MELKLRKTGNSLSTIWPKEILNRLRVGEGETLYVTEIPGGVMVTPADPKFAKTMANTDAVIRRFREAYRELADR